MKCIVIVLDSVGIGQAPDAARYGDEGAATLPHIATAVGGLKLPILQSLGLGNIPAALPHPLAIEGVPPAKAPLASHGGMRELSEGKDTVTGHWEIGGLLMDPGFAIFPPGPPSFSPALIAEFERLTGRRVLANRAASGTGIIEELGAQALAEAALIVYTSADSVFQIAAHVDAVPLADLYSACEIARGLCDPLRVGRVIARPFRGPPGAFERTLERRDYAFQPNEPTILERVFSQGVPVYAVGKIEDIFAHRGLTESNHTGNNVASQQAVEAFTRHRADGLIFANFIDFDMQYGHRRDPRGYAQCLEQTDAWLGGYLGFLRDGDLLILTADHGNDPTFRGTDHTREIVPLLVYRRNATGRNLGLRTGFFDVAQSIASFFGLPPLARGVSFL
jgi:phosphopentomutase